ncbi:MAG: matrixin family metalloprotease [Chitinivibrionia bacterium]|nr:matrixin family metalloprotease [Chitinivibrionia bacterium]
MDYTPSDMAAIVQAMTVWTTLPGSDIQAGYAGTTPAVIADAFDGVNMITFKDPIMDDARNRYFSDAVIAVGITTSFTTPAFYNGRWYRPGEILDADMLFNPGRTFTTSGGAGIDLQSVATHEAGHLYGLSHSAVRTSTMFPILGHGTETASLTIEDTLQFVKAYPGGAVITYGNYLQGTIEDYYGNPVRGAAVFAINAGTGDTTACEYTLSDGRYLFLGLPDGSYYVSIYPLNGTSPIGYLEPAAINWLIYSWGATEFVPEFWDGGESAFDNPLDATAVSVNGGATTIADIITNIDLAPPTIIQTTPADNAPDVRADGTIMIKFSEAIDYSTLQGNFRLVNTNMRR